MGNSGGKPSKRMRSNNNTTSHLDTAITKVTLEGILLNENNIKNTKTIQLLDCNGKISTEIITVSNNSITSCIKQTRPIPTPKSELILTYWFRTTMNNEEEYILVDKQLLCLILEYSKYEISIRLTRPVSLGIAQDMHHLHIRQIEVYSRNNEYCHLLYKDASRCMKISSRTPKKCIDGDTKLGSFNHNDYSDRQASNSEDHWMEFIIDYDKCQFINDVYDIDYIKIYNRMTNNYIMSRIRGSVLQLMMDGNLVKNWTLNETKREYKCMLFAAEMA